MHAMKNLTKIFICVIIAIAILFVATQIACASQEERSSNDTYEDPSSVTEQNTSSQGLGGFFNLSNNTIEDGYYRIKTALNNDYCADVAGGSFDRGANVQLYSNNNTDAQLWRVYNQNDGYIIVVNVNSGQVLDVANGECRNEASIQSYYSNHTQAQLWHPESCGGNNFILRSALNNNYVIDLSGGNVCDSSNIQLYENNYSNAQKWHFEKQDKPKNDIPSLDLALNGYTLDQINNGSKDTKYTGNTLVVEEDDKTTTCSDVQIKGRGNSTWDAPKKPYNIKLADKVNLFGLGKAKNWVLLANYYDASLQRNDIAFHIAKMLGIESAFGGQQVNLYIDHEYVGMYYLTHKVEIGKSSVPCEDDGLVVELDGWGPDDIYYISKYLQNQMILKDTKATDPEAVSQLANFESTWNEFERLLLQNNFDEYSKLIDVKSFALLVLLNEVVQNADYGYNSTFFYKKTNNSVISSGPPWDYDAALGNLYEGFPYNDAKRSFIYQYRLPKATLSSYLMQSEQFRSVVEEQYKANILGKHNEIINHLANEYNSCRDSSLKNARRWSLQDPDYANSLLKSQTSSRLDYLDTYFAGRVDIGDGYYTMSTDSKQLGTYKFEKQTDGFYRIINTSDGGSLTVEGGGNTNDTKVINAQWEKSDIQKWLVCQRDGKYVLISKKTGLVFDCYQQNHIYNLLPSSTQLFTLTPTSIKTLDVADGAIYEIDSCLGQNNICMSAQGSSVQTGAGHSISSTLFKFNKCNDGTYIIVETQSGKAIDVAAGGVADGTKIQLYDRNDSDAQKWTLLQNADNTTTFVNKYSWKTLDVAAASTALGTRVQLYQMNKSAAQSWSLTEGVKDKVIQLAKENKGTIQDGTYTISTKLNSGYVVDVAAGSIQDAANVQLYQANNTNAQKWSVQEDEQGFLTIINIGSRKCLDVAGANVANQTNVWQYSSNNSYAQKWIAVKSSGAIKLVSALNPNMVLDLSGGSVNNSTNIQIYQSNDTLAQRWMFKKIS